MVSVPANNAGTFEKERERVGRQYDPAVNGSALKTVPGFCRVYAVALEA
jgi:hypothetical protein